MMKLVARKPMTYGTRHLVAGEVFEARPADARLLKAIRKAADHVEPEPSDVASLRAQYEQMFGKRPFMGWDADALREKIASGPTGT